MNDDIEYKRRISLLKLEIQKCKLFSKGFTLEMMATESLDDAPETMGIENTIAKDLMKICDDELIEYSIIQGKYINYLEAILQKKLFSLFFDWIIIFTDKERDPSKSEESLSTQIKETSTFFKYLSHIRMSNDIFDRFIDYHENVLFEPLKGLIKFSFDLLELIRNKEKKERCAKIQEKEFTKALENLQGICDQIHLFHDLANIIGKYVSIIGFYCQLSNMLEKGIGEGNLDPNAIDEKLKDLGNRLDELESDEEQKGLASKNYFENFVVSVRVLKQFNNLVQVTIITESDKIVAITQLKEAIEKEKNEILKKNHEIIYRLIQLLNDLISYMDDKVNNEDMLQEIKDLQKIIKDRKKESYLPKLVGILKDLRIKFTRTDKITNLEKIINDLTLCLPNLIDKCILGGVIRYLGSLFFITSGRNPIKKKRKSLNIKR